jgi:hypothetical protein
VTVALYNESASCIPDLLQGNGNLQVFPGVCSRDGFQSFSYYSSDDSLVCLFSHLVKQVVLIMLVYSRHRWFVILKDCTVLWMCLLLIS